MDINIGSTKKNRLVKSLDWLMTASIFMLFLGLPLFLLTLTSQGIAFEKQIYFYFWSFLALASWVIKGMVVGKIEINRTPLDIPLIIFLIVYVLTTIFSVDRWHSFVGTFGDPSRGLMNVVVSVLIYYLIFSNFNLRKAKLMFGALAFSGSFIILWSVLGLLGVKFLPTALLQVLPLSLVGSVSSLTMFVVMTILVLLTTIFGLNNGDRKIIKTIMSVWLIVLMLLGLFLIFLLYSFISWPAIIIGVTVFSLFIIAKIIIVSNKLKWLVFFLPLAIFLIWVLGDIGGGMIKVNMPMEVSPSYGLSWQIAKNSLKEKALLGAGPGMYAYDFVMHKPLEFNNNNLYQLRFQQGKGMFFEMLSTMGIVGIVAVLLVAVSFISVTGYFLTTKKGEDKIYSLGSMAIVLALLTYTFLNLTEISILLMLALIGSLAMTVAYKENEMETDSVNLSLEASAKFALLSSFVFLVVSAGIVYMFVFIGKTALADVYARQAMLASQSKEAIGKITQTINLNPKEGHYYTILGQYYMLTANEEMLKKEEERSLPVLQKNLNNSIVALTQSVKMMPKDIQVNESLAQIYENASFYINGSIELAEKSYQKALELDPHNPTLLVKLGQLKTRQATMIAEEDKDKRKEIVGEAKELFEKAIAKKGNLAVAHYNLALAHQALGEIDEAIKSMNRAAVYSSNNINYIFNLASLLQERGNDDDNKLAEALLKEILGVNDKEINSHFSLAQLYEKTDRRNEAIAEYEKVKEFLPKESTEAREQINKIIDKIRSGGNSEDAFKEDDKATVNTVEEKQDNNEQLAPSNNPEPTPTPTPSGE